MQYSDRQQPYAQILDRQPLPPWNTNTAELYYQTITVLHDAAAKAVSKDQFTSRQTYVTTNTMNLIRPRRHIIGAIGAHKLSTLATTAASATPYGVHLEPLHTTTAPASTEPQPQTHHHVAEVHRARPALPRQQGTGAPADHHRRRCPAPPRGSNDTTRLGTATQTPRGTGHLEGGDGEPHTFLCHHNSTTYHRRLKPRRRINDRANQAGNGGVCSQLGHT